MACFPSPRRWAQARTVDFERLSANRHQELNNYSDLMTRRICDGGTTIYETGGAWVSQAPAGISDGAGSRRHQEPARRSTRPATIRLMRKPTGCPVNVKVRDSASPQASAGSS